VPLLKGEVGERVGEVEVGAKVGESGGGGGGGK
jgi:hypothetical protein